MTDIAQSINSMTNYKALRIWTGTPKGVVASLGRLPSYYGVNKPNFIIKWGPPASGKGSPAVKAVIESLGYPQNTYVNFNIDDIIEATNYFRNESMKRAQNYFTKKGVNSTSENNIVNKLNNINQNNATRIGGVYSQVRNGVGTNGKTKLSTKLTLFLEQAISLRKNITFETTGMGGWPDWIFTERGLNKKNYNIHIIFPLTPFPVTWERYRRRAAKMFLAKSGFRFASWKDSARLQYKKSYEKFSNIIDRAREVGSLQTITVLPFQGAPIRYTAPRNATNEFRLRSRNLMSIKKEVAIYKNTANATS
jgi:hypothetical protein